MSPGLSSSPRCLPLPDFLCPEVMSQSSTVSLPQNHQEEAVGSPMCPPHTLSRPPTLPQVLGFLFCFPPSDDCSTLL